MNIIGVNFGYHDSSAALLKDGKIVFHSTEDKFTKIKHDNSFPYKCIAHIIEMYLKENEVIDEIVIANDFFTKISSNLKNLVSTTPRNYKDFESFTKNWFGDRLWIQIKLSIKYNIDPQNIKFASHHLCHAANAFINSQLNDSVVAVIDGVGDDNSLSIYDFKSDSQGNVTYEIINSSGLSDSLCLLYSLFTYLCGLKPNDSECSTMALSSFCEPTKLDEIEKLFESEFNINSKILDFRNVNKILSNSKLQNILKDLFKASKEISLKYYEYDANLQKDEKVICEYASSVQKIFEDKIIQQIKDALLVSSSSNLCLSGGAFLNCKLNQRIQEELPISSLSIPFAPGDSGNSIGACFVTETSSIRQSISPLTTPFIGKDTQLELLDGVKHPHIKQQQLSSSDSIEFLSNSLKEGKIVAIAQGRCESGPRALGNRSILARADKIDLIEKLNKSVKRRPNYRPYALVMTEKASKCLLETTSSDDSYKWMQISAHINTQSLADITGGTHIDKTTRPQIVTDDNTYIHKLLVKTTEWNRHAVLINTSFNESGMPINGDALDCYICFLRTDIDIMLIENTIFIKGDEFEKY